MTTILHGDCRHILPTLEPNSIHCCVTSPPYYAVRDYDEPGQIGLESTLDEYLTQLHLVFALVRKALRPDGTLWLNISDTYCSTNRDFDNRNQFQAQIPVTRPRRPGRQAGTKRKDLLGIPWTLALTLRDAGWYLRSDIIWAKPNPMPESINDRPTRSHEYVFLLSKSETYYYERIEEPVSGNAHPRGNGRNPKAADVPTGWDTRPGAHREKLGRYKPRANSSFLPAISGGLDRDTRNARSVWTIPPQAYRGPHTATFPEELARRCILAGCPEGGTVLDPFAGTGTVARVARANHRNSISIEISERNIELITQRTTNVQPTLKT